jgi:uncharacterized protein YndB with AHSA1/START domain
MPRDLPEYHFVDHWHVPAPIERVYDVLGDVVAYPTWWGDVWVAAEGEPGLPVPGRVTRVVSRGFLPYKLRFTITCLEVDRPRRIHSRLNGDFEGTGTWTFEPTGDETDATLDWHPSVAKPIVRLFTPVVRPLFRANHDWAMTRGQQHLVDYVHSGGKPTEASA